MIITIDGPAGTGKTTVARSLALRLKFHYFDTGAMYRAVTYCMLKEAIDLQDTPRLVTFLSAFRFAIEDFPEGKRYFVGEEEVTEKIRSAEVTRRVSEVSAHPKVREQLMAVQRAFGEGKDAVFEGRDKGTVVFPKAQLKIFLTASPAVRAERRYLELKEKNTPLPLQEVFHEMDERDHLDTTRKLSPLRVADNAHVIDTSDLTIEQIIERILSFMAQG